MKQCLAVPLRVLENHPLWKKLKKTSIQHSVTEGMHAIHLFKDEKEKTNFINHLEKFAKVKDREGEFNIEHNPEWQQPILYIAVWKGNKFLAYQRSNNNGKGNREIRHASKVSIGIGGHVEPGDTSLFSSFYREVVEELTFFLKGKKLSFINDQNEFNQPLFEECCVLEVRGVLKTDKDDLSKVHIGIVGDLVLLNEEIEVVRGDEEEIQYSDFVSKKTFPYFLEKRKSVPEEWTKMFLEIL